MTVAQLEELVPEVSRLGKVMAGRWWSLLGIKTFLLDGRGRVNIRGRRFDGPKLWPAIRRRWGSYGRYLRFPLYVFIFHFNYHHLYSLYYFL